MPRLALRLLGPPTIEHDGLPVKLNRRKAIALLAYLAVTGAKHPRDSLVNLLWPELDSRRGRAALRRTLYTLNQALAGTWFDADREEIGLAPRTDLSPGQEPDLWVDVTHFRKLLAQCETHEHATSRACPACLPLLTEALDLVRGEFLSGFSLKDSINFDDWQLFQAEMVRRELANALETLVEWHSGQRQFELAIGYARRTQALDPLDEQAHRQLMRLYAWSGRRSAALRQYEECVHVLDEQLGVPPQETTTELYRAIQAGRAPPPPKESAKKPADLPTKPPPFSDAEVAVERPVFVARGQELARLNTFLDLALDGQSRVAFVTGEAGNGKTALINEFSQRAQEAHADLVVASGNCNAYTGLGDPYLPFRELLELLTGDVEAKWAAGALTREHTRRLWNTLPPAAQALVDAGPDLIGTFVPRAALLTRAMTATPGPPPDWLIYLEELSDRKPTDSGTSSTQQSDLFEQYTRVLQVLGRRLPLLLVVDDLQWADLGSISLLFHLGRHLAGSRILILGAYRSEEVAIGRERERHPLELVVNEFRRDFGDITLDLGQAASRDFLDAFLDSEPNRLGLPFRDMLYRQTRGHPLFTIELLRGMQERGDVVRDPEGRWAEGPALDWETLPARVEAAIAERIGRLAQPLRDALQVASVEGEEFTAEVVARILGTGERDMALRLSSQLDRRHRLIRAQAIERLGSRRVSRYRFRNFLFQKYLYDSLDEVERSYLHEDVGNALEGLYGDEASQTSAIAPQLAWHFEEAGSSEKAIRYLHQAGERAVQLSDHEEGVAHLTKALALLLALPDSGRDDQRLERAQQELALQLSLGMAWMGIAAPEVERAFIRARELCQQLGQTSQLCRILGQLSIMLYVQAEYQKARELGEETLRLAEAGEDPLLVALSHWQLGFVNFALGQYTIAQDHLNRVISFYTPREHHQPFIFLRGADAGLSAQAYAACCSWCLGFPEQALRQSQCALAQTRQLDHPFTLADVLLFAGCMLHEMRRDAPALKSNAEALIRLATEERLPTWLPLAVMRRGDALVMLGQLQEGMALIREGMAAAQSAGVALYLPVTLHCMAKAQALTGHPGEGLATLAEALEVIERTDERHWEAELYRLRGELLLTTGRETEAEASFQQAVDVARRQSAKAWELRATVSLTRLWQRQGRAAEARHMLAQIYDWFTEGFDTRDLQEVKALLEELAQS